MPYPDFRIFGSEKECRDHFHATYCVDAVLTFDNISVRFRKQMFDHCFFESSMRNGTKDRFSQLRAERIDWIYAALRDTGAELFVGYDSARKREDPSRRVALVQANYVVVIALIDRANAVFVTAYVADYNTVGKIRRSSKWT